MTVWLGEGPQANPLSVSFYAEGIAINFRFLWDRRSPDELIRLAALAREIPGVAPYLGDLEARELGIRPTMRPDDVLMSDEALATWKRVIVDACRPRGDAG